MLSTYAVNCSEVVSVGPDRIVVAAHSGFLLALCNAVLTTTDNRASAWFGTGECRALGLTWEDVPTP